MNDSDPQSAMPEAGSAPTPPQSAPTPPPASGSPTGGLTGRQWALFLHLSQILGYVVVPVLGLVGPIIIWQVYKERFPELDAHGKMVTNWVISFLIYFAGVSVITIISCGIGAPLYIPLFLVGIIFSVIGGVKANEGVLWNYPLTIKFLK